MQDSTNLCLYCLLPFNKKRAVQKYCCLEHQKIDYNNKIAKKKMLVDNGNQWKKNTITIQMKFFEIFGMNQSCDICGMTFDENMDKHNIPLRIELRDGIRDWRVMDLNSYFRYCFDCYVEVLRERENK